MMDNLKFTTIRKFYISSVFGVTIFTSKTLFFFFFEHLYSVIEEILLEICSKEDYTNFRSTVDDSGVSCNPSKHSKIRVLRGSYHHFQDSMFCKVLMTLAVCLGLMVCRINLGPIRCHPEGTGIKKKLVISDNLLTSLCKNVTPNH